MPRVKRTMKIKTNNYHLEGNTDKLSELTSSEGVSWGCSSRNRRWRGIKCLAGGILTSGSVPVGVTYGVVKKNPQNSSLWHKGFIWVSFKARAPMPDYNTLVTYGLATILKKISPLNLTIGEVQKDNFHWRKQLGKEDRRKWPCNPSTCKLQDLSGVQDAIEGKQWI